MNFKKLQAMQLELDNSILSAKPQMTAEERFNKTCVALSVEVSEVANCAEYFKFWKDGKGKVDEKRFYRIPQTQSEGITKPEKWCELSNQTKILSRQQAHKLTLVEECSDVLHSLLSIANQLGYKILERDVQELEKGDLNEQYFEIKDWILVIKENGLTGNLTPGNLIWSCMSYFSNLGITTQELEQAYYEKNEENYRRLREGY